ncbi:MAG: T9SS type A sorting domain-containing protein [Bacteroidota bacterium]
MKKLATLIVLLWATVTWGFSQSPTLPLDFESTTVTYTWTNFGGGNAAVIANPQSGGINTSANVGRMIKAMGAVFGGSLIELANPIDFSTNRLFKMKVYSPRVGARVLLKVENSTNGGIFFEKEDTSSVANAWEELSFDFGAINQANQYSKVVLIWDLGVMGDSTANFTFFFDDIELIQGATPSKSQIDLPVTFDDTANVDYTLTDFGGASTAQVQDPAGGTNLVARTYKTRGAATFAGTTMGPASGTGFATPIPLTASSTEMTVRVWSPAAGIPVRLKVEDQTDPTISVETEDTTTVAGAWETLTFDFSNQAMGTAAINFANTYDKASIFFHFGSLGNAIGNDTTFYWDDVQFAGGGGPTLSQIDLPVTFDDATVDYSLTDFGGASTVLQMDPAGGTNMVARTFKTLGAATFAGTTMGPASGTGFASAIPFAANSTEMTVRVWSPAAGIPVRLKVEDQTDPTISVETEDTTTVAGAWETLTFDFSNQAMGTAAINFANTYDKASIFFHFGSLGNAIGNDTTFYWDDVQFGSGGGPVLSQIDLPVTFDDATVDYTLTDFAGAVTVLEMDPTGGTNTVARTIKTRNAATFAGTTMGPVARSGFANPVPFTMTETIITVRVYSPAAGLPVRLKVEDQTDPTISVETEDTTTAANTWETLTFDFSNEAPGTAALNLANTYDMASIFFHFNTDGVNIGNDSTFYWDDVQFGIGGPTLLQIDLPVTFEDPAVDYTVTDFGGASTILQMDPDGSMNTVARSIKTRGAATFAGTTMGHPSGTGFANPIPFTATETKMNVRVYSPAAGIPVRVKVEDQTDPTISVETEDTTTVANTWEVLEFDFSNEAPGTAAIDINNTYDKASIFFFFGTDGANVGNDSTFYWDDCQFGPATVGIEDLIELGLSYYPNPVQNILHIEAAARIQQIEVFNLVGQPVMMGNAGETSVDLSGLTTGMYLVRVRADGATGTFRVLKE